MLFEMLLISIEVNESFMNDDMAWRFTLFHHSSFQFPHCGVSIGSDDKSYTSILLSKVTIIDAGVNWQYDNRVGYGRDLLKILQWFSNHNSHFSTILISSFLNHRLLNSFQHRSSCTKNCFSETELDWTINFSKLYAIIQ